MEQSNASRPGGKLETRDGRSGTRALPRRAMEDALRARRTFSRMPLPIASLRPDDGRGYDLPHGTCRSMVDEFRPIARCRARRDKVRKQCICRNYEDGV